jgi:hypothetical protein
MNVLMKTPFRKILFSLLALVLLASPAMAAMGDISDFSFAGFEYGDILGPGESAQPDGNPDAVFTITITGIGGAIANLELRSEDGKSVWDTKAGNNIPGINVKDGNGNVLAASSGNMPITPFLLGTGFVLTVHDNGSIAKGGKFTVKSVFVDGSETTASVAVPATAKKEPAASIKLLSAKWVTEGLRDLTGRNERLAGDGKQDLRIRAVLEGTAVVTGITVRTLEGDPFEWDTVPGNRFWLAAAVRTNTVLNSKKDGSVKIELKEKTNLDLFLSRPDSMEKSIPACEVLFTFSDGSVLKRKIDSASAAPSSDEFAGSAILLGEGERDLAGLNEQRAGNGKPDWETELKVSTAGTITGINIRNVSGKAGEWDTVPGNKRWLIVVTDQNGKVLNRQNGSVSIPVSGAMALRLWMDDNDSLADGGTRSLLTLTYDDGRTLSRELQRKLRDVASSESETEKEEDTQTEKRQLSIGSPRQASSSDYVGLGERPKKSGKKDWVFDLQISGKGEVKSMELQGTAAGRSASWDTIPRNRVPLLGVFMQGKGLLNNQNGAVSFPVPPNRNLMLFVEDDGFLSRRGQKQFQLTVRWSDGTETRAMF